MQPGQNVAVDWVGTENTGLPVSPRSVTIEPVENGFIIRIGCKVFVASNWETVQKALAEYFKNPTAAQKKYCRK